VALEGGPEWLRWGRDALTYLVFLALIVYEAVARVGEPRVALLVLYGSGLGLPAIVRATEALKK
jgi:hypothetical protein